jgi:hypothetical protein
MTCYFGLGFKVSTDISIILLKLHNDLESLDITDSTCFIYHRGTLTKEGEHYGNDTIPNPSKRYFYIDENYGYKTVWQLVKTF